MCETAQLVRTSARSGPPLATRLFQRRAPRWRRVLPIATVATLAVAGLLPATAAAPSGTRTFEVNVTHGLGAGEPEVAADPVHHTVVISFMYEDPPDGKKNPDGSMNSGCGIAVSRDRGKTWRVRITHPTDPGPIAGDPYHQCSDPTAATGASGTLYIGAGWWDSPAGIVDSYNTYVSRSTDGGMTWGPAVFATGTLSSPQNMVAAPTTPTVDRQWLAADSQTGTVYASVADLPRTRRWIVASHDQGRTLGRRTQSRPPPLPTCCSATIVRRRLVACWPRVTSRTEPTPVAPARRSSKPAATTARPGAGIRRPSRRSGLPRTLRIQVVSRSWPAAVTPRTGRARRQTRCS